MTSFRTSAFFFLVRGRRLAGNGSDRRKISILLREVSKSLWFGFLNSVSFGTNVTYLTFIVAKLPNGFFGSFFRSHTSHNNTIMWKTTSILAAALAVSTASANPSWLRSRRTTSEKDNASTDHGVAMSSSSSHPELMMLGPARASSSSDHKKKKKNKGDDGFAHLMECLWEGGSSSNACHAVEDCSWCAGDTIPSLCVSVEYAANLEGDLYHCDSIESASPTMTPVPTVTPTESYVIVDDDMYNDDQPIDDDYYVPPTAEPSSSSSKDKPTSNPTPSPSPKPTNVPTPHPTPNPTPKPSPKPTPIPAPTPAPTYSPEEYSKRLMECLQLDKAGCAKKKKQCHWCQDGVLEDSGLCFSIEAAADYDGPVHHCKLGNENNQHIFDNNQSATTTTTTAATTSALKQSVKEDN